MTDMAESEEKTSAVNDRVQQLEDELESTRERLRVAESLLPESAVGAVAALAAATATTDTDLGECGATPASASHWSLDARATASYGSTDRAGSAAAGRPAAAKRG